MSAHALALVRQFAGRLVVVQSAAAGLFAVVSGLVFGLMSGFSALFGGMISVLASALYARVGFAAGSRQPAAVIRRTLLGEAARIIVTVALFAIFVIWVRGQFLPMLLAYVACQAVYWLAFLKSPVCAQQENADRKS